MSIFSPYANWMFIFLLVGQLIYLLTISLINWVIDKLLIVNWIKVQHQNENTILHNIKRFSKHLEHNLGPVYMKVGDFR